MDTLGTTSQPSPAYVPEDPWHDLLRPLLTALKWRGQERDIAVAQAAIAAGADLITFRELLANLGYGSLVRRASVRRIDPAWLPVVTVDRTGRPQLLISADDQLAAPRGRTTVLVFDSLSDKAAPGAPPEGGWQHYLSRFRPIIQQIAIVSLFIGVLALAPAFFNKGIYDEVIGTGNAVSLPMLLLGSLLALFGEVALRVLRNRQQGYFGARIDHFVSCTVFERLLFLPPAYTERAPISSQIARLRDFEAVREFFTGPLASMFFELPLVLVYLIFAAAIGTWLATVPLALVVIYCLLIWLMQRKIRHHSHLASAASSARHGFLLETVGKLHALRRDGMEEVWQKRYRGIAADASLSSFRAAFAAQILEVASYILMSLGGVATLAFGVYAVINQDLTVGALIATMMLTWRILSPLQMCCSSATRMQQLAASTEQVKRLMSIPIEREPRAPAEPAPALAGGIALRRVSLKYAPDAAPALLGVNFDIKPGQVVAITGPNGSGKSSLIKLILGLYHPQAGSVQLDGVDLRQIDPVSLRHSIAYAPQKPGFIPGTLRENLLLAAPTASDAEIERALVACGGDQSVDALPLGLDTVIAGEGSHTLGALLEYRINLARCHLRNNKILLIDEMPLLPDMTGADTLFTSIGALRGQATIVLVTRREDLMRAADLLIVLAEGEVTHAGPPGRVLQLLQETRK